MTQSSRFMKGKAHCAICDAVCCRLTVLVEPEDNIPDHLTTLLPEGTRAMAHLEDGWCAALDRTHMNCGIYENRPDVCRRFVMGGRYCNSLRGQYGLRKLG